MDGKLSRAYEHLNCLKKEIDAWVKTKPYGVIDEVDPEPPPESLQDGVQARRMRVNRVSSVPANFSLVIGDCLFNLRSSLDHLAFALARKHTTPISDKQIAASEFPIFGTEREFAKAKDRRLGCVHPAASEIIESFQPYQGGNSLPDNILWQIHELNRVDKHRSLTVCGADIEKRAEDGRRIIGIPAANLTGENQYWNRSEMVTFEMNAIWVRRGAFVRDGSQNVSVDVDVPITIVFDKGGPLPLRPVVPTLQGFGDFVSQDVIPKFAEFL